MKKNVYPWLVLVSLIVSTPSFAQTFSDDFESYTAGDYVALNSPYFTTWSGTEGAAEDVKVVNNFAYSGTNSLYFSSSLPGGGPQDLYLPFPELTATGHFQLEMALRIGYEKSAHFNIQKYATPGYPQIKIDFYQGILVISDSSQNTLLFATYPQLQWFTFRLDMDLNTNTWRVYRNNTVLGSFQAPATQISALDIYPPQNGSFWLDDISYEYNAYTPQTVNAALYHIDEMNPCAVGQTRPQKVTVRNLGNTVIQSFDLSIHYKTQSFTQTFGSLSIQPGGMAQVITAQGLVLEQGADTITATVSNVNGGNNDTYAADDVKKIRISPASPANNQVLVVEAVTGTQGESCPGMYVTLDHLKQVYGNHVKTINIHRNDPMAMPDYNAGLQITDLAQARINRSTPPYTAQALENGLIQHFAFTTNSQGLGALWDAGSRQLKVSLTTFFRYATTEGNHWRIALVITENQVTGSGPGWEQNNAFAGGSLGPMGGYENLPDPVPAAQMIYNDVARFIQPSVEGYANPFPNNISDSTYFTYTFHINVPQEWDETRLELTGLLFRDSLINNAVNSTIPQAVQNGYIPGESLFNASVQTLDGPDRLLSLYPNPCGAESVLKLELTETSDVSLSVCDLNGKELYARRYGKLSDSQLLPIRTTELPAGMYWVRVSLNGKTYTKKLVKQ